MIEKIEAYQTTTGTRKCFPTKAEAYQQGLSDLFRVLPTLALRPLTMQGIRVLCDDVSVWLEYARALLEQIDGDAKEDPDLPLKIDAARSP